MSTSMHRPIMEVLAVKIYTGWLILILFLVFLFPSLGATAVEVYFEMKDPVGDENGYGTYRYPSNVAFQPYQGLFDITEFKVWRENPGLIYFDKIGRAHV